MTPRTGKVYGKSKDGDKWVVVDTMTGKVKEIPSRTKQ
jgi:hypothetical protein